MEKIKLSESEIRDITQCIESGKPLAEKYRFLLFADKKEVELVWNGKTSEVFSAVLPFQAIEVVDEPRSEKPEDMQAQPDLFDERGRQMAGWTNKLIWGDNKLILSSLKSGPMREVIEKEGGLKLIYIDPPFDVGADFSMNVEIGGDELTKKPSALEEMAYRDTWGHGADSFIAMIYERLSLMRDLLADDGSIYVHCDWRVNSYIKMALDEIFGKQCFINEVIWSYKSGGATNKRFSRKHDTILFYSKCNSFTFNEQKEKSYNRNFKPYRFKNVPEFKDKLGWYTLVNAPDVWLFDMVGRTSAERFGYPTQKPEALLERIIKASSNEGDLVADFFCGSGTTCAVAEKLGRKWIGSDLGRFAVHTTRKRMIGVQREMKKSGKGFRAFEILNLGKYERQYYIGVNPNLRDEQKKKQLAQKETEFIELILRAYKAKVIQHFKTLAGEKAGRLVAIGPINFPVSQLFVEEVIKECTEKQIIKADILAFEFEMGLLPKIQEEARDQRGLDLAFKHIPREVFDKQAVEKNQVQFHDVSYIEVKPHLKRGSKQKPGTVAVELTDFSVYYNQDIVDNVVESLKKGRNKVLVEQGNIVKISKDRHGVVSKEILTRKWSDWIDYWAVDFDFESRKEIVRFINDDGKIEEAWSGDYVFENEWQSFRTKKERTIELQSVAHECRGGRRKIAVKVVDIFGNDTMKVIEVTV